MNVELTYVKIFVVLNLPGVATVFIGHDRKMALEFKQRSALLTDLSKATTSHFVITAVLCNT